MPIYEYRCGECGYTTERIHGFTQNCAPVCVRCLRPMPRVLSVPCVTVWKTDRLFPGLGRTPTGKAFPSKQAYESYIAERHMAEVSTDTKRRPATTRVYKNGH